MRASGLPQGLVFRLRRPCLKGQCLADIDTPDLDAQLAAAKAKLMSARASGQGQGRGGQFAETTYARWRDSPKGVVSVQEQEAKQADFNSAVARHNSAQAEVAVTQGEVDQLKALEDFKRIVAPFDGIVTARNTDIGALINAGSGGGGTRPELFRVADVHEMRVFVQVPQQLSAGIRAGLSPDLILPQYPDKTSRRPSPPRRMPSTPAPGLCSSSSMPTIRTACLQPGAFAQIDFDLPNNPYVCASRPAR